MSQDITAGNTVADVGVQSPATPVTEGMSFDAALAANAEHMEPGL